MRAFVIVAVLIAGLSPDPAFAAGQSHKTIARWEWDGTKEKCKPGLYPQPDGPFAVLLFCEDALGNYLSVLHLQAIQAPSAAAWSLEDRYWSAPLWSDDVTGFRWSRDGKTLLVTTSEVYGSGGAFALALRQRKETQLSPASPVATDNPGPGFNLRQIRRE